MTYYTASTKFQEFNNSLSTDMGLNTCFRGILFRKCFRIKMGILSVTAITCTFFLLTSIGQMHQNSYQHSHSEQSSHGKSGRIAPSVATSVEDDFAEFDDEFDDGVASSIHHQHHHKGSPGAVLMDSLHHADEDEETLDMGERPLKSVADSGNQGQAHSSVKSGKGAEEMQDFKTFDEEADEDDDVLIVEEERDSSIPSMEALGGVGGLEGKGGTGHQRQTTKRGSGGAGGVDGLKVIDVPEHLRTKWDGFYLEFLLLIGLVSYALNFIYGRQKNQKLASAWLEATRGTLERNFSVVGDDGTAKEVATVTSDKYSPVLMKESEHVFSLWCSGRLGCQGMLIDLKFVKRQDIISLMSRFLKPASDLMEISVTLDEDFEPLIFALGSKKILTKNLKELQDLSSFCDGRKSCERFKCPAYCYASELHEVADFIIDSELQKFLKLYPDLLEYLHISDQYSGKKPDDSTAPSGSTSSNSGAGGSGGSSSSGSSSPVVGAGSTMKVLQARFAVPKYGRAQPEDMAQMLPCLKLVIYFIDKLKRIKLSKDARAKAEKNRVKMEETISKMMHSQRQESQQQRREEKVRQEKERLMTETDPDKLRKLEDAQAKREKKRNQPKMKSMVVRMK